jgi:hypothetical protein
MRQADAQYDAPGDDRGEHETTGRQQDKESELQTESSTGQNCCYRERRHRD